MKVVKAVSNYDLETKVIGLYADNTNANYEGSLGRIRICLVHMCLPAFSVGRSVGRSVIILDNAVPNPKCEFSTGMFSRF
jgi:hypothetical protein